jgi:hypothetical protein
MISKDFIQKMLEWVGSNLDRRVDEKLVNSYHFRLKSYDEDAVRKIIFKWVDVSDKFPKISDIIAQLPRGSWGENEDYKIQEHMMCNECHKANVSCIKEPKLTGIWRCRQCYTGLTSDEIEQRFKDLGLMMGDNPIIPKWVSEVI